MSLKNKFIASILFMCSFNSGTFYASENDNIVEKQDVVISTDNKNSNLDVTEDKVSIPKNSSSLKEEVSSNVSPAFAGVLTCLMLFGLSLLGGTVGGLIAGSMYSNKT